MPDQGSQTMLKTLLISLTILTATTAHAAPGWLSSLTRNNQPDTATPAISRFAEFGNTTALGNWQNDNADMFLGYEAALIGGLPVTIPGTTFSGLPQSLKIQAAPYGPYSAGCALCLNTGPYYSAQAAISEADPRAGAPSIVGMGGYDLVGFYEGATNQEARMVLSVDRYTPNSATLTRPLTPEQAALLHPGMYLITNSLNPNLPAKPAHPGEQPPLTLYSGIISGLSPDRQTLTVYGWAVPGAGSGTGGQIPSLRLDHIWSHYDHPTVFIGAGTHMFGRNLFMTYDARKANASSHTTSLVRSLTAEEIDLNITGHAAPHSVKWTGFDMNAGNQPDALTSDSHQFYMGGNIADHLIIDGACGNLDLRGNGFVFPTMCGSSSNNPDVELGEFNTFADGANDIRFVFHQQRLNTHAPVPIGWESAVPTLGVIVDGERGHPTQGSHEADLEWNQGGHYGGLSICGYGHNCGFTIDGNGRVTISQGLVTTNTTRATLPAQADKGTQLYCTDCSLTAIHTATKGIPIWWNGTTWADALGEPVTR